MFFRKKQSKKKILDYHCKPRRPTPLSRASRVYYLAGKIKWQRRILISLVVLILSGIFYFLFYSDFFKIQEIRVTPPSEVIPNKTERLSAITEQSLNQKRFFIFSQRNFFLFNKNQLREKILAEYNFEELKISKKFPGTLEIGIKEKLPLLILDYQGSFWFLDEEGQILEKATEEETRENLLPLVSAGFSLTNLASPEIFIKQKIFSKERVHFISEIFFGLSKRMEDFKITFFRVPAEKETKVVAKTQEGWEIYFDQILSLGEQLNNLSLILKEKIKGERKNLKYIDLRFGEKVYYK